MPLPLPGPPSFPPGSLSPAPAPAPALARRLQSTQEGSLRYELDTKGRWRAGSPVGQGVALSLAVPLGGIPSAPQIGHELGKIPLGQRNTGALVADTVVRAYPLREYLAQKLVETIEIRHEETASGGLLVEYVYREANSDEAQRAFFPARS